tara:strand:+ start:17664 stop:18743 length:1080 start_codon:yes stop_codon:yes gene_type:complete
MIYLFWVFNFFVISTNGGRYIIANYGLDLIFNTYIFLSFLLLFFLFNLLSKRNITDRLNIHFFICGIYLLFFNLFSFLFGGNLSYFFASFLLISSYYIGSMSFFTIRKFVIFSLIFMFIYTFIKILSGFFGFNILPFTDIRYDYLASDGVLRFSNSIVFGQRNAAGSAVACLFLVYSSLVYVKYIKFSVSIFLAFLFLGLSAFSATSVLVMLATFILISQIKLTNIFWFSSFIGISLLMMGGFFRKIDSLNLKIKLFFEYFESLSLQSFFIGSSAFEASRVWVESSLLDMIIDIGFLIPFTLLLHFAYFFLKNIDNLRMGLLYSMFLVLFIISNSSTQPPMIICLILSYNILNRKSNTL